MKTSTRIASLLLVFAGLAATAITPARVSRPALRTMEKNLDARIAAIWPDNPLAVVGPTRAVYLDGYGAVFTAEVSLASSGISLMHAILTDKDKLAVIKTKNDRVPQLKKTLEDALVNLAASLDAPPTDQVVIEVILDRYDWEDRPGYPAEMIFQATRQTLLDLKKGNAAGIESAIRETEH